MHTIMPEVTTPDSGEPPKTKRCAIVGTAATWKLCPWQDHNLDILGLNDAYLLGYRLSGQLMLPRQTHWFDLHRFHEMYFRPREERVVLESEIPVGSYVRPQGHLEWLRTRPHPVILHDPPPSDWPSTCQAFPWAQIREKYGDYFTSTPAWMLVWAIEQGYREIHVYGIHLATEWEYVEQRPCFEQWMRYAIDRGCKIVLPVGCPLLKGKRIYACESKADLCLQRITREIAAVKRQGAAVRRALEDTPWYAISEKQHLRSRLRRLELELVDLRSQQQREQFIYAAA